MPWSISDVDKHHAGLTPQQKAVWVEVANNLLSKGASDGNAIRQANTAVNRMRSGGLRGVMKKLKGGRRG